MLELLSPSAPIHSIKVRTSTLCIRLKGMHNNYMQHKWVFKSCAKFKAIAPHHKGVWHALERSRTANFLLHSVDKPVCKTPAQLLTSKGCGILYLPWLTLRGLHRKSQAAGSLTYSWSLGGVALRERTGADAQRASFACVCVRVFVSVCARASTGKGEKSKWERDGEGNNRRGEL